MIDKAVPARGSIFDGFIPCRYILAILGSIGMGIVYGLKVNLSVAIVGMVNHSALLVSNDDLSYDKLAISEQICNFNDSDSSSSTEDGPFEWSNTLQGAILSSYFWGYIVAQIPGGRIAELFSAKWVMFFSVAINTICTLLTPLAAKLHYGAMIAMRIGEGIGGGVTFPAMHVMLAHWALPNERSVMSSIVYAGTSLGTVASMLLTGVIAGSLGWEAVFYIMGSLSIIWLILWIFLVGDTPETLSIISENERTLIATNLNTLERKIDERRPSIPWRAILKSAPFWAILVAHTCSNWGWYMVLIELPLYMKSVLQLKITESAEYISMAFLGMWFFSIGLSKCLDLMRSRNWMSTTWARKTATLWASLVPMVCFIALCYIECWRQAALALMMLAIITIGGMFSGYLSNHIDIAPNYAGTLMAITNTVATIPGIVVPVFVGQLTEVDPSIKSWRIIFWTTAVLYAIEIVIYTIFGSGEEQKWNKKENDHFEAQPLKSPNLPDTKPDYETIKN